VFRVPVAGAGFAQSAVAAALAERYKARFHIELHEMVPVLASLRTTVTGRRRVFSLELLGGPPGGRGAPEPLARRPVYFGERFVDTPVFARDGFGEGASIAGPAIVQQPDATIVIDPGTKATLDRLGNIVIDVGQPD
jgi:N-methylhydantoinase A